MKNKNLRRISLFTFALLLVFNSFNSMSLNKIESIDPYFTLVFKTNGGGVRPDYGYKLQEQLELIGINLTVIVQDWPTFVSELIIYRDFDLCYVGLQDSGRSPDYTGIYDENGSLNLFGYSIDMDYHPDFGTGINQWYMDFGNLMMPSDSANRIQHYWDWEQYMMNNILPLQPTFTPYYYTANWANLDGYDVQNDLIQSWGKMSWNGAHSGQASLNEIVYSDENWSNLNPLFNEEASDRFINKACLDPLIWYDSDVTAWPHIAESYPLIDETTCRITIREGIKWADAPGGVFTNEYLDIHDVYFTLYCQKYLSYDQYSWNWIEDLEIIDDYTLDITIDGDPDTPEYEPYADFMNFLEVYILPEHYLNQTQLADGVTPDILDPSWNTFSTNCFGTGLFEMSEFTEGVETVLTVRSDSWWHDPSITYDPNLNWVTRFGSFTGYIVDLVIRDQANIADIFNEFETGHLDIIDVFNNTAKRDEYLIDSLFDITTKLSNSYGFFGYNMREIRPEIGSRDPCPYLPEMTKGLAIRKAISYAMNRVEMNNEIHNGDYAIVDWPIQANLGIWCNPNIIQYNHNLPEAINYMSLAGYGAAPLYIPDPPPIPDYPDYADNPIETEPPETTPPETTPTPTTPTNTTTPTTDIIVGFTLVISVIGGITITTTIIFLRKKKKQ